MLKTSRLAALAILGIMATSPVFADDKSALTVNGVTIPAERLELLVKAAESQGQSDTPELRKTIRDNLINNELVAQEALKKGLDKQSDVIQQEALAKQNLLANAYVQDYVKTHPVTDEAITQEYQKVKSALGNKEYSVRHILVEKESEAKSLAAKLKKGGNFDKLAKASSKDAGSKDKGGDLGWIPVGNIPNVFVKPFGDALMNLTKGQVSEPVQSQFGWHVIKLDDVRDLQIPPQEKVKDQITQRLQQQMMKDLITDLRAKAKIE